ncbi:MAG TPA: DUF4097 family beta strand repeat-containing protein [Bryobacteraceae bacterium]|nr:DUF4097 family beta strand repeat-containing protein [Bryobacteraceae bacterium]
MRSRSVTGPLVLVLIGFFFLLNNIWRDIPFWSLFTDYWPILLIVVGVIGLVEVLVHASRGAAPPPRPIGVGGFFWVIVLIGFLSWGANRGGIHIGPIGARGVNILGTDYDYDVNATGASQGVTRVVLDNLHGNLSLRGEDSADVKVSGRKTIRAFNRTDADRANQQSEVRVERQGDLLIIRAEEPQGARMLSVSTDLDITVPKGLDIEARGRSGDLTVDDIAGSVDISNGRGDVRLNSIGKDVKVEASRSGLIKAADVKGSLELQGRGGDVQLENIQGQVTVDGEYSGTLEFRALAKPLHFRSQRSDFRVEKIPGSVTLDLSEMKMSNVVGPVRFQTGARDIQATDVTNSLELTVDRGDIQVTQTKAPLPKLDLHSRNGDITVTVPASAGFELDGRTGQGEVNNVFGPPLQTETDGRVGTIKGKVGAGPQITLGTERGALTIRKIEGS